MVMSLAHVLLTSLLEKPSTGSDLARRLTDQWASFGMQLISKYTVNSIGC